VLPGALGWPAAHVSLVAEGGKLGVTGQVYGQLEHSERNPFVEEALVDCVMSNA